MHLARWFNYTLSSDQFHRILVVRTVHQLHDAVAKYSDSLLHETITAAHAHLSNSHRSMGCVSHQSKYLQHRNMAPFYCIFLLLLDPRDLESSLCPIGRRLQFGVSGEANLQSQSARLLRVRFVNVGRPLSFRRSAHKNVSYAQNQRSYRSVGRHRFEFNRNASKRCAPLPNDAVSVSESGNFA